MWAITFATDLLTYFSGDCVARPHPSHPTSTLGVKQLVASPANRNKVTGVGNISFPIIYWIVIYRSGGSSICICINQASARMCGCDVSLWKDNTWSKRLLSGTLIHSLEKGSERKRRPRDNLRALPRRLSSQKAFELLRNHNTTYFPPTPRDAHIPEHVFLANLLFYLENFN